MAFTDDEIARYLGEIEKHFWSKRRPPLEIRDKVREGQRVEGQSVELFLVRPRWNNPSQQVEEPIAKATWVRSRKRWKVYWQRADLKWHLYDEQREVSSLRAFLELVDEDKFGCFWG